MQYFHRNHRILTEKWHYKGVQGISQYGGQIPIDPIGHGELNIFALCFNIAWQAISDIQNACWHKNPPWSNKTIPHT